MGSFSNYLEGALLQHIFSTGEAKTAMAVPDKYVALCTATVDDTKTGTTITEPGAGAYARVICSTWDDCAGAGVTENSQAITFPQATTDWGKITDFAICDAATTGELLAYGTLTVSKSVQTGDTPKFDTGDLDITLD